MVLWIWHSVDTQIYIPGRLDGSQQIRKWFSPSCPPGMTNPNALKLQKEIIFKVGMNWTKMAPHIKIANFLLEWQHRFKRVFCASAHEESAYQILLICALVGDGAHQWGRYPAHRSQPHPTTSNYLIFHQMWLILQMWWVLGFFQAPKNAITHEKKNKNK